MLSHCSRRPPGPKVCPNCGSKECSVFFFFVLFSAGIHLPSTLSCFIRSQMCKGQIFQDLVFYTKVLCFSFTTRFLCGYFFSLMEILQENVMDYIFGLLCVATQYTIIHRAGQPDFTFLSFPDATSCIYCV